MEESKPERNGWRDSTYFLLGALAGLMWGAGADPEVLTIVWFVGPAVVAVWFAVYFAITVRREWREGLRRRRSGKLKIRKLSEAEDAAWTKDGGLGEEDYGR